MNLALRMSVAACRTWTRIYTRPLPADVSEIRIAEIESDLWEHQAHARTTNESEADTAFAIATRFLLGIPADLSWRRAQISAPSAGRQSMNGDRTMLRKLFVWVATGLALFMGVFFGYVGIGRGADGAEGFALWPLLAGVLLVAGVVAASWSPRIGTTLVAAGALGIIAMMPWMIAITLPLGIVAVTGTMMRERLSSATPDPA